MDDELLKRRIERALAVEPPAQFVARVGREPAPATWFVWWKPVAAGGVALAIAAGIMVTSIDRDAASVESNRQVAATVFEPVASPANVARDRRGDTSPLRPAVTRRASTIASPVVSARSRERRALRLLIANIREGRIDPAALENLDAPALVSVRDIPIAPIDIDPVPQIALLNAEALPRLASAEGEQSW